jgi:hypothetical protein
MSFRFLLLLLILGITSAFAEVYPNFDDPLERLVYGAPNHTWTQEQVRNWQQSIADYPGAKAQLFELFERDYNLAKDWELVGRPLMALTLRSDLKSEDLDRIEKEMIVAAGQQKRSQLGSSLLSSGIPLLVLHPTPKRESLVVRLARDEDWSVVLTALRGLITMGSKEAKTEIENAVTRRRIPGKDQSLDWILSEVTTLLSSFEASGSKGVNPPPALQPPAPKKAQEAKPHPTTPSEEPSSTPWSIIVVLIVAATGLLWLLVKNRK